MDLKFQLLASVEHLNIRLRKFFLIPLILIVVCTSSYSSLDANVIVTLQFISGLMLAFETATDNASYLCPTDDRVVKVVPFIVFLLANVGKIVTTLLLAIIYTPGNFIGDLVNYTILAQTILTMMVAPVFIVLSCDPVATEKYRFCRLQMEGYLFPTANGLLQIDS